MTGSVRSLHLHIGLNARRTNAESWGDLAYADGLAMAFRGLGHSADVFYRDETPSLTKNDVVIRIVGPHLDEPVPNVPNLLWMISPPNITPMARLRRFQSVFFASAPLAKIYAQMGVNAAYLPQASDTNVFKVDTSKRAKPAHDIVFVGNRALRAPRLNILRAIEDGFDIKIWGAGWDDVLPPGHLQGTRLSIEELATVYASAKVVLNSHMPDMAKLGFMSNRTFDALASGAIVVSDHVDGFADSTLVGLFQTDPDGLAPKLREVLATEQTTQDRQSIAEPIRAFHGFDARARSLAHAALKHLQREDVAPPALSVVKTRKETDPNITQSFVLRDCPDPDGGDAQQWQKLMAAIAGTVQADVTLELQDPSTTPAHLTTEAAMERAAIAIWRIGKLFSNRQNLFRLTIKRASKEARKGVIHPLMPDHRNAQNLALADDRENTITPLTAICEKARRVLELSMAESHPLTQHSAGEIRAQPLIRMLENRPLYPHSPEGFSRDQQKRHLMLWPKNSVTVPKRSIGVFLHLFYEELAPVFRDRLANLSENACAVYISTDTDQKADKIARHFPDATISVFPNRGRDVFPKLFGFGPAHDAHDIVLHLHGKKSIHAQKLDEWLDHCLACLLPERDSVQRILSLFEAIPALGMIAPLTYKEVLGAAHWGDNAALAQEIMLRMGLKDQMPDDANLNFPVGSMFWARSAAIRPLLDLKLGAAHFPAEGGQVDATPAHAIERLFGVVCEATNHRMIRAAPKESPLYRRFRFVARTNRDVRDALAQGLL